MATCKYMDGKEFMQLLEWTELPWVVEESLTFRSAKKAKILPTGCYGSSRRLHHQPEPRGGSTNEAG